jgi:hypothetical protein
LGTGDLLASIFKDIGEPINLTDVINVVSDIRGVKDALAALLDANGSNLSLRLPDSKVRVDSVLEMRQPLMQIWQGLRELPRDQFRAYLLYARDSSGEDLINLLVGAEIATEEEIALLLGNYLGRKLTPHDFNRASDHVHSCKVCYRDFLSELQERFPIEIDLDELAGDARLAS